MRERWLGPTLFLGCALAILWLAPAVIAGQTVRADAKAAGSLRTPWGDPDLQGLYNTATLTPLERPEALGNKLTLTDAEAAAIEKAEAARRERAARPSNPD